MAPFKMKGMSFGNSPMKQDKMARIKNPGKISESKYTLKVGTKPDGTKDYFKVDESGKSTKISEATYNSMKGTQKVTTLRGKEVKLKDSPGGP